MNLSAILGGACVVLLILLGIAVKDDIHQRGLLEAESIAAQQQKADNAAKEKQFRSDLKAQEARNAEMDKLVGALNTELVTTQLREREARAKRAAPRPVTASVCTDPAANDRLAQAVSSYRSAVDSFRDAVGDFRIAVLELTKDAQQCTNSLVSCQGWANSVCRAGICE